MGNPRSQSICHSDYDITSREAIGKFPPRDDSNLEVLVRALSTFLLLPGKLS